MDKDPLLENQSPFQVEITDAYLSPSSTLRLFAGVKDVDGVAQKDIQTVGPKPPYAFVILEVLIRKRQAEPLPFQFKDLRVTTSEGQPLEVFGMLDLKNSDLSSGLLVRAQFLKRDFAPDEDGLRQMLVVSAPFSADAPPVPFQLHYLEEPPRSFTLKS
jgi:hypothetical protein